MKLLKNDIIKNAKIYEILSSLFMFVLAIALTGCAAEEVKIEPTVAPTQTVIPLATTPPTPKYGGEITLSMNAPKTLNPLLNEDETVDLILKLLFEPLMIFDESLKPIANTKVASNITFALDGLTANISLNNLNWSDGENVTAYDVAFSIETLKSADDTVIYKDCVKNIESWNVESSQSIIIKFSEITASTPYSLFFPIIPRHYYSGLKFDDKKNLKPVGNGSYVFENYILMQKIMLKSSESINKKPYIKVVNVLITPDAFLGYEQGLTDAVIMNDLNRGKYKGKRESTSTLFASNYFDFIGFNYSREMFLSNESRKAIAHIMPLDEIINNIYLQYANPSITPINPDAWLYENDISEYEYDLEAAAEILSGRNIEILVNEESDYRMKLSSLMRSTLQSAGANVVVTAVDYDEYLRKLENLEYDLFLGGMYLENTFDLSKLFTKNNPALGLITDEESNEDELEETIETPTPIPTETPEPTEDSTEHEEENLEIGKGYVFVCGYASEQLDTLLMSAAVAIGDESRLRTMSNLQKYLAEQLPIVGVAFRYAELVTSDEVYGEIAPELNNPYANIEDWFVGRDEN